MGVATRQNLHQKLGWADSWTLGCTVRARVEEGRETKLDDHTIFKLLYPLVNIEVRYW